MSALLKIKRAGFDIALVDGFIEITPASELTQIQLDFLKSHKAEIVRELQIEASAEEIIPQENQMAGARVTCFTPNGQALEIEARDTAHAEWLKRMNPNPHVGATY